MKIKFWTCYSMNNTIVILLSARDSFGEMCTKSRKEGKFHSLHNIFFTQRRCISNYSRNYLEKANAEKPKLKNLN
jgi:hypothetical protein